MGTKCDATRLRIESRPLLDTSVCHPSQSGVYVASSTSSWSGGIWIADRECVGECARARLKGVQHLKIIDFVAEVVHAATHVKALDLRPKAFIVENSPT